MVNENMDENSGINENFVENENKVIDENANNSKDNKITFKDTFLGTLTDIIVTGIASAIILFIVDGILRITCGYYVKEKIQMTFIIYLIVSLLYRSIMEGCKNGTIGQKYLKLRLIKRI